MSFEITLMWGFFAHDRWTFAHVQRTTSEKVRFIKFNIFATVGLGVNEVALVLFTEQIKLAYYTSEFIAMIVAFF